MTAFAPPRQQPWAGLVTSCRTPVRALLLWPHEASEPRRALSWPLTVLARLQVNRVAAALRGWADWVRLREASIGVTPASSAAADEDADIELPPVGDLQVGALRTLRCSSPQCCARCAALRPSARRAPRGVCGFVFRWEVEWRGAHGTHARVAGVTTPPAVQILTTVFLMA